MYSRRLWDSACGLSCRVRPSRGASHSTSTQHLLERKYFCRLRCIVGLSMHFPAIPDEKPRESEISLEHGWLYLTSFALKLGALLSANSVFRYASILLVFSAGVPNYAHAVRPPCSLKFQCHACGALSARALAAVFRGNPHSMQR
jgi:hypothetical protein